MVMLHGILLGMVAFLSAEVLVPKDVRTPGMHDFHLAVRLGYIFPPLVGLWLGWQFRSTKVAGLGVVVGVVVGAIYAWLCSVALYDLGDFFHLQVTFPCVCGGIYAALVPTDPARWVAGLAARLIKGLLAGFVLGFVYMMVLSIGGLFFLGIGVRHAVDEYVGMMWAVGPVALAIATALFLPLLRWAVGQTTNAKPVDAGSAETKPTTDNDS